MLVDVAGSVVCGCHGRQATVRVPPLYHPCLTVLTAATVTTTAAAAAAATTTAADTALAVEVLPMHRRCRRFHSCPRLPMRQAAAASSKPASMDGARRRRSVHSYSPPTSPSPTTQLPGKHRVAAVASSPFAAPPTRRAGGLLTAQSRGAWRLIPGVGREVSCDHVRRTTTRSVAWCGVARHGVVQRGVVRCSVAWCGAAWRGVVPSGWSHRACCTWSL